MPTIKEIFRAIGSGLTKMARTAEATVGNFERIFGRIQGPGEGMADASRIMARTEIPARRGRQIRRNQLRLGRDRQDSFLGGNL